MEIKLDRKPRCKGASDENCVWGLIVNGYVLGSYYGGKDKKYLNKEKWAKEQIKKRIPVLERNIKRLKSELLEFEDELLAIKE